MTVIIKKIRWSNAKKLFWKINLRWRRCERDEEGTKIKRDKGKKKRVGKKTETVFKRRVRFGNNVSPGSCVIKRSTPESDHMAVCDWWKW